MYDADRDAVLAANVEDEIVRALLAPPGPPRLRGAERRPCPDCGGAWPYMHPQCPSCGLDVEDVAAAADFFDGVRRRR